LLQGFDFPAAGRAGVPERWWPTESTAAERGYAWQPLRDTHQRPRVGVLRLLTYNVAGLPWIVAGNRPRDSMPRIGRLLNDFDLALVQEDFAWHAELSAAARHAFRSRPGSAGAAFYGDGLSTFSSLPFATLRRVPWGLCNGVFSANADCLANKGFSVAEIALTQTETVHVYNLHADAGRDAGDRRGRAIGFAQLAAFVRDHSDGHAVIIAGDTNLKPAVWDDQRTFGRFLRRTGLTDACRRLRCGDERIDRVLFRGSPTLALEATEWRIDERFVDPAGEPLSDHAPVAVTLAWRALHAPGRQQR
jgi:hypothetical protein